MFRVPTPIWSYGAGDAVWGIAINAETGVVAAGSCDHKVYLLDDAGEVRWVRATGDQVWGVSISQDGRLVAAGSDDDQAYLFDHDGERVWAFATGANVIGVAIAADRPVVAICSRDMTCQLVDIPSMRRIWRQTLDEQLIRVAVSSDASTVAVSSYGRDVYLFDADGFPTGRMDLGAPVWGLAMDAAGTRLAVAVRERNLFALYTVDGELVWSVPVLAPASSVAMTPGAEYVVAGCENRDVLLLDADGHQLWRYEAPGPVISVAISTDGRSVALGTRDGQVLCLDNPLPPTTGSPGSTQARTARIVRRVRADYVLHPVRGLARLLYEFDRILLAGDFGACEALLMDAEQLARHLSSREVAYIESRRAALWMCTGIERQRRADLAGAQDAYQTSLSLHARYDHLLGQTQAQVLLSALRQEVRGGPSNVVLLDTYRREPRVLGSAVQLLLDYLEADSVLDRRAALEAAASLGYAEPLEQGLTLDEPALRALAAAGLARLDPGPDTDTLVEWLSDQSWLVRWRAAVMLRRRALAQPDQHEVVHRAVTVAMATELLPEIMCELIAALGHFEDPADAPHLLPLLQDSDPDVRLTASELLGDIGDRHALPWLAQVVDGRSFEGARVAKAAQDAAERIARRFPLPSLKSITVHRDVALDLHLGHARTLFFDRERSIVCVVEIDHLQADTLVCLDWRGGRSKGEHVCRMQSDVEPAGTRQDVEPTGTRPDFDRSDLIELVQPPAQSDRAAGDRGRVSFRLTRPKRGWLRSPYRAGVSINGDIVGVASFRFVKDVPVHDLRVGTPSAVDGSGLLNETGVFLEGEQDVACSAALSRAPTGTRVQATLIRLDSGSISGSVWGQTTGEGDQQILLKWIGVTLHPGGYLARVLSETGATTDRRIEVVPSVRVLSATTGRARAGETRLTEMTRVFRPDDDFACLIQLGPAPAHFEVAADWHFRGASIVRRRSMVLTQVSGPQQIVFRLSRPDAGWPVGQYSITIYVNDDFAARVRFFVEASDRASAHAVGMVRRY